MVEQLLCQRELLRGGNRLRHAEHDHGITQVTAHGNECAVLQQVALAKPFCNLLRFKRFSDAAGGIGEMKADPVVLVVAPLSGHHSTLLRDTVKTLLADHKVYITDWVDARMVPAGTGAFGLDDYVDYIREFINHIGADTLHVISVCQPTVPVLAAVSLMASNGETTPLSLTMMGGPIDPRENPTQVNSLATTRRRRRQTQLLITPQLEGIELLDWAAFERAEAAGYEHTCALLEVAAKRG